MSAGPTPPPSACWDDLPTPAFLVDEGVVRRNALRMQETARRLGVRLRPHVKTHKTVEGARIQTEGGFEGITVSTLAEAHFFHQAGFEDITYAFPVTRAQLSRIETLAAESRLNILVDHNLQVDHLEEHARRRGVRFRALLEVDFGYGRSGVGWDSEDFSALARRLESSNHVDFEGLLTHAGHSYAALSVEQIRLLVAEENQRVSDAVDRLRRDGIEPATVSIGSTPTLCHTDTVEAVTEVRPGNYLFFDKTQADLGSCRLEDCAVSVLATVISHYPARNTLLVDAGALAMSKDPGAAHLLKGPLFGEVIGHPELKLRNLSQEHGIVTADGTLDLAAHPIGSRLRIVPNHSCLTAACFAEYHVLRGGRVEDIWRPVRGWSFA